MIIVDDPEENAGNQYYSRNQSVHITLPGYFVTSQTFHILRNLTVFDLLRFRVN